MTHSALILFAHGARDPEWAAPIRRVRDVLLAANPDARVELAFLEFMSPTLTEAAARLYAEGFRQLIVVPMFIAQGGHLKRDVPQMLETLRQEYPGLTLRQTAAIGEVAEVISAMAAYAAAQLQPTR